MSRILAHYTAIQIHPYVLRLVAELKMKCHLLRFAFFFIVLACVADAQVITTVAGTDWSFPPSPLPAIHAPLGQTFAVATDPGGNVYIADVSNHMVSRVAPDGTLTVVAGNGLAGYTGDGGPAVNAALTYPAGLAVDVHGNIYISDSGTNVVRKVTPDGVITTIAGNGSAGFSGDEGPSARAQLSSPGQMAADHAGNVYVCDWNNNRVRKVTPGGTITTFAGNGESGDTGDGGPATRATLSGGRPGLAVDGSGNLYIADEGNGVRKVTPGGTISTVPFTRGLSLNDVAIDATGNLFMADDGSDVIWKLTPGGVLSIFAGVSTANLGSLFESFSGDGGPATKAFLNGPFGVAVDATGTVYIADTANYRIRKVPADGIINTMAGNGVYHSSGDGGAAANAALFQPVAIALDILGNLFISDSGELRIREVSSGGIITTVAGNGVASITGDGGPATKASFEAINSVAVDNSEVIFVGDSPNVRKFTVGGSITSLPYRPPPASVCSDSLFWTSALASDAAGNLYVAASACDSIFEVKHNGAISIFAGNGQMGFAGDRGPAEAAEIQLFPASGGLPGICGSLNVFCDSLAVDGAGNVYIADFGNYRVRKVTPDGIITTVAGDGNGSGDNAGDGGPATSAHVVPAGLAVDREGNLYIADGISRVRMVKTDGIITTVAGNGTPGFAGDGGSATSAELNGPLGLVVDASGNLYISDAGNNRIRVVLAKPPSSEVSPKQLRFTAPSGGAPAHPQQITLTASVTGLPFSVKVPDSSPWLQVTPLNSVSPRLVQVVADPTSLAASTKPYQTTITIETPYGEPTSISIPVSFTVGPGQPPTLTIDKTNLSFPYSAHGSARSQTILVSNSGGGKLNFAASTTTVAGGRWLAVAPGSGQALPASPATLTVTANPSGLSPGTYAGEVIVTAGSQTESIPVTMIVSPFNQAVLLSLTGLSTLGVSQGGVIPSQSFGVLNTGTGVMNWKASISTVPPRGNWLQVTPSSGETDAAETVPTVQVSINAASLAKGTYYGSVLVDAPGAANTPEVLTVVAQVLESGSATTAMIQPSELLFTTAAKGESPGSQNLFVYNVAAEPKSFQASVVADPGLNLSILPTNATLDPERPTPIVVQPFTNALAAGVYNAAITLQFSDGNVLSANVKVIVAAGGANSGAISAEAAELRDSASGAVCTPTKLVLASNTLAQSFAVPAGWPVGLAVGVKDDCGTALNSGSVIASFSNGDPALELQSLKNGLWNATWQTSSASAGAVTVTLQANDAQRKLQGKSVVSTSLSTAGQQPVFTLQGIVSAAGGQSFVPVAPGSLISIRGSNLAGATMSATSTPLPIELGDTIVAMGGLPLRLSSVSAGQISAQVPFEIQPNTTSYLLVGRTSTLSFPVGIDVAPAQPAIFLDTSVAPNQGKIFVVQGDTMVEATPKSPAKPGDTIVISCAGLGAVSPAGADGAVAGANQHTSNTAKVTIGGQNAQVSFAGLTPGLVGMYQITAVVPANAPTGNGVQVTIQIAGQISPAVVMAIQ